MLILGLIILGLVAGALSGLIGIGGGVIIVPALVFLFSFSQKEAQGTTLALLVPPLGIFAATAYYKAGYVDLRAAGLIIVGFIVGSIISSHYAIHLPSSLVSKVFGVFLIVVAIKLILGK